MNKLIQRLRILPRWIIVLLDLIIISGSFYLAYLLRFNFDLADVARHSSLLGFAVFILSALIATLITKSYAGIIRYTGLQDGFRILTTGVLQLFLVVMANALRQALAGQILIPLSVIVIAFFVSMIFLFTYRLLVKNIFSYYAGDIAQKKRIAIFGAGQGGILTKQVIDGERRSSLKVVAFFEDDDHKVGKEINGTRIFHAEHDLDRVLEDFDIRELIISIRKLSLKRKNEIVDACLRHGVKVRSVPPAEKWVKGELSLNQIKEINIEDLLGRESIKLDNANISRQLAGKVVCITGAAGSIGSEIVRQVMKYHPSKLILIDQAETALYDIEREMMLYAHRPEYKIILANIIDEPRMRRIFKEYRPNTIFHAAAYKHVPMVESHPEEAIRTNVLGTRLMADLAVEYKTDKFVLISTDKAVNPTNVMGCSKRISEMYVQALNHHLNDLNGRGGTRFVTTRFGNVLGSNGSVIPYFKKQIAKGGPITVTHPDITRYFMTIPEACQLVLEAGAMGKGGEIYIFDMGDSIKIVDLAEKMVKLSGLEIGRDIEIVYTGLRQGEKLFEELLCDEENTAPTHHDKILIARVLPQDFPLLSEKVEALIAISSNGEELEAVRLMKDMVPEFISNSSRFEELDKLSLKFRKAQGGFAIKNWTNS